MAQPFRRPGSTVVRRRPSTARATARPSRYFRAAGPRFCPPVRTCTNARLSLIHVGGRSRDRSLALAVERPPPARSAKSTDGREGGYGYGDMQAAAEAALGRRPGPWQIPGSRWTAVALLNDASQALGGPARILTRGKVHEIVSQRLDGP